MKSKTSPISKNTSEPVSNEQIERIKLDLLSLVSHELRTPLTSVLGSLKLLKEEDLGAPERQKLIELACRNAERLNSTLSELLDLSRLASGRLTCRFHEVSLKHLLIAQVERAKLKAESLGQSLDTKDLDKALAELPVILGDAPRLEQVFDSLFDNAFKFSPQGSKTIFKLKIGARGVVFELKNPMKPGAKAPSKDLFAAFSQQERLLNRSHEGVGGSLAIGSEVLRQHGGKLSAEVKDGQFAIRMELPVLENEKALLKVLESRMYGLKTDVGGLSLLILQVGEKSMKQVSAALKGALFRASDTVYGLGPSGQIAVVMDDCKKADAPKIVKRLLENMGAESAKFLKDKSALVGLSSCPEDALEPQKLVLRARKSFIPISEL